MARTTVLMPEGVEDISLEFDTHRHRDRHAGDRRVTALQETYVRRVVDAVYDLSCADTT